MDRALLEEMINQGRTGVVPVPLASTRAAIGWAVVRGIGSRHALCGAQPLAPAASGVSQALSFFDPAIINLPIIA
jgi:hypothetical protein